MKKCSKCGEVKPLTEFYKHESTKDRLFTYCKVCKNKQNKEYRENNPEKVKETRKKYYKNNLEKIKEQNRKWVENNLEKVKENQKEWARKNRDKRRESDKKWRKKNLEYFRNRERERLKDPVYKFHTYLRRSIYASLKGNKNGHWEDLVGYTLEDLMQHLESKFEPWMNWENHGIYEEGKLKWHIDHIRPISSFNLTSAEDHEFRECWALENLQPLEARENIIKSNNF
jgi:flagellar biosynthesis GTPase FlhF